MNSNLFVPAPRRTSKEQFHHADYEEEEDEDYAEEQYYNQFEQSHFESHHQNRVEKEGNLDEDRAPSMSNDYYASLDSFLKKPPPKIGKKYLDASESMINQNSDRTPLPVIPNKPAQSTSAPPMPPYSRTTSKIKSIIQGRNDSNKPKAIDENLLQQAFAYTEQLALASFDEDDGNGVNIKRSSALMYRNNNSTNNMMTEYYEETEQFHPNSAPPVPKKSNKSKKDGKNKSGLVKKIRKNTQNSGENQGRFDVSCPVEENPQKAALDFDALVSNFSQGITLQKLKAELEQSQMALAKTKENMKRITFDAIKGK